MRLIDADKLLKDIEQYHLSDGFFQHWVEVQPTIEGRKKGKWKQTTKNLSACTSCGNCILTDRTRDCFYCPNCGADMREEMEMTTKDAIKHLSDKIDFAEQCDDKWVDSVSIKALYIAVRAMAEERKRGKWKDDGKGLYMCSSCGELWTHWWARIVPPNQMCKELRYCPMCGAEMEKSDETN